MRSDNAGPRCKLLQLDRWYSVQENAALPGTDEYRVFR